jgi:anti-anti-sigma regulatory factor
MPQKSSHVPKELYHRIYWYAKQGVDAARIAHALKLPLKTVEMMLEKLADKSYEHSVDETETKTIVKPETAEPVADEDFLDVFIFVKTRFVIVDISGMVEKQHLEKLVLELEKIRKMEIKAAALRMAEVQRIDEHGAKAIITFHQDFLRAGRYTAILDPSPQVDAFLAQTELDKKIAVFGTETAFEGKAFR